MKRYWSVERGDIWAISLCVFSLHLLLVILVMIMYALLRCHHQHTLYYVVINILSTTSSSSISSYLSTYLHEVPTSSREISLCFELKSKQRGMSYDFYLLSLFLFHFVHPSIHYLPTPTTTTLSPQPYVLPTLITE